ncbi:MAG TPA: class I SAM-dependent methyltransferase [Rhodanobacteraceae bacterium]|nr:class I SAM-dependent methyltransferase [Rhodanobacteraceae bacterium]
MIRNRGAAAGLTEEDVRYAYRMILGREPESDAVVREQMESHPSFAALREAFIGSNEFRSAASGLGPAQQNGFEPALAIDRVEDRETMQRLLDHVAAGWSHYGETDPHWSVLTEDRFRKERLDVNRAAFDALGHDNAERFLATLARNGVTLSGTGHCLELGCGVGRITRWLAPHFARITGVDVSPGHLELARAHVSQFADNADFMRLRRIEDIDAAPPIDAFYSFIVLQHNPPPIMEALLDRIFARMNPGGIAYFQLPTYIPGYRFNAKRYLAERGDKLDMEMHVLPQARVFEVGARHGVQPLEALCEIVNPVVSYYFLMRKSSVA